MTDRSTDYPSMRQFATGYILTRQDLAEAFDLYLAARPRPRSLTPPLLCHHAPLVAVRLTDGRCGSLVASQV